MIANLLAFIALELGSGFCQNLEQFLAVRSLYGIAMGVSDILPSIGSWPCIDMRRGCSDPPLRQRWKTFLTMLEASFPGCSSKPMVLATCWPPSSTEL